MLKNPEHNMGAVQSWQQIARAYKLRIAPPHKNSNEVCKVLN